MLAISILFIGLTFISNSNFIITSNTNFILHTACDTWMNNNQGKEIAIYNIADLVGETF